MRWDRLIFAAFVALIFSILAGAVLMIMGMGFVHALAVVGLCWVFGTVAALAGTEQHRRRW